MKCGGGMTSYRDAIPVNIVGGRKSYGDTHSKWTQKKDLELLDTYLYEEETAASVAKKLGYRDKQVQTRLCAIRKIING